MLSGIAASCISSSLIQAPQPAGNPYGIDGIGYEHFSHRENTLRSPAEHSAAGYAHWNELDHSLLIRVTVRGREGSYEPSRGLRVIASQDGERVLDRTFRIGPLSNETGRYTIAFLVEGPLCGTVRIGASIEGQKQAAGASREIEFHCGE